MTTTDNRPGPRAVTMNMLASVLHEPFQPRVHPWMIECFGPTIPFDKVERNHRFLEEAIELVQAGGCSASEAHQLVDYVFGRPVGELSQEVGGVMVTLAALCIAHGVDMHDDAETELARIWTKVPQIRAKQASKPKHSPLPQAAQVGTSGASAEVSRLADGFDFTKQERQDILDVAGNVADGQESVDFWGQCVITRVLEVLEERGIALTTISSPAAKVGTEDADAQATSEPEWAHLKRYGYAPGDYMNKCHACGKVVEFVDKRAITCRPCAEAEYVRTAPQPPEAMAPAAPLCACKDRLASQCDEEWGPGCDLGNNPAHIRVSQVDPALIDAAISASGRSPTCEQQRRHSVVRSDDGLIRLATLVGDCIPPESVCARCGGIVADPLIPQQPTTHQERVIAERDELAGRLERLCKFTRSDAFDFVEVRERRRLLDQQWQMGQYLSTLNSRIAAFAQGAAA